MSAKYLGLSGKVRSKKATVKAGMPHIRTNILHELNRKAPVVIPN